MEQLTDRCERAPEKNDRPKSKSRLVIVIAACLVTFGFGAVAYADIIGGDIALLTEISATEAASLTEISTLVSQAAETVALAKEYTGLAKTAYRGIEELTHMTWDDLKGHVLTGLSRAFPEVGQMYADVKEIKDLRYVNPRSVETLRGILWSEVYGPAIDELHGLHANMDAVAEAKDLRGRQSGLIQGIRDELDGFAADCEKGPGACAVAADNAQIRAAQTLTDIHEATLKSLEMQERARETHDNEAVGRWYELERVLGDLNDHMAGALGIDPDELGCRAGECLYRKYAGEPDRVMAEHRQRHPRP